MLQSGTNCCEIEDKLYYRVHFTEYTALKEMVLYLRQATILYCTVLQKYNITVEKLRQVQFMELKQWYLTEVSQYSNTL
jgi:hypothetical protein